MTVRSKSRRRAVISSSSLLLSFLHQAMFAGFHSGGIGQCSHSTVYSQSWIQVRVEWRHVGYATRPVFFFFSLIGWVVWMVKIGDFCSARHCLPGLNTVLHQQVEQDKHVRYHGKTNLKHETDPHFEFRWIFPRPYIFLYLPNIFLLTLACWTAFTSVMYRVRTWRLWADGGLTRQMTMRTCAKDAWTDFDSCAVHDHSAVAKFATAWWFSWMFRK